MLATADQQQGKETLTLHALRLCGEKLPTSFGLIP
jgi:hypothetical protein